MSKLTVEELNCILQEFNVKIKELMHITGFDNDDHWHSIEFLDDIHDLVMSKLSDVCSIIEHMRLPVIAESVLSFDKAEGRYRDDSHVYRWGDFIEFYYYDDWERESRWCTSTIEHDGSRFYILGFPNVKLDGLRVRHRM